MSVLNNYPIVDQLADAGEVNKDWDCVPASIASGLEYLTGKKFTGAELKDAAYGAGYQGGTAAVSYVEFCANQGVRLYPVSGSNSYLAAQAHALLAKGQPVVFTEPDPYDSVPGMTHVCVMCGDTDNSFTYMDPFGGKFITVSDTDMINRFSSIRSGLWRK